MTATATKPRDMLAEITSSECDAESTAEALLACFDAVEEIVKSALSSAPTE